ncbi:MAG: hypothetical protein KC416_02675 [Myxococcales bacterium]|nr:hypothetical protein [Myxococcales bacterium]
MLLGRGGVLDRPGAPDGEDVPFGGSPSGSLAEPPRLSSLTDLGLHTFPGGRQPKRDPGHGRSTKTMLFRDLAYAGSAEGTKARPPSLPFAAAAATEGDDGP